MGFLFLNVYMKKPSKKTLQLRQERLEMRLMLYGLENNMENPGLFDETQYNFVHPVQVAERMLILLAVSYTAYDFNTSEKVMDWLKQENIWKAASEKEKEFFRNPDPDEEEKQKLSWRFEGAYTLAWVLGKVNFPADPTKECEAEQIRDFFKYIPSVGSSTNDLFTRPDYRPLSEVIDETLFYDTVINYFRKIRREDKENTSPVHVLASPERNNALAWIQSSGTESDWDALTTPAEK
jgi:hypothetical protein